MTIQYMVSFVMECDTMMKHYRMVVDVETRSAHDDDDDVPVHCCHLAHPRPGSGCQAPTMKKEIEVEVSVMMQVPLHSRCHHQTRADPSSSLPYHCHAHVPPSRRCIFHCSGSAAAAAADFGVATRSCVEALTPLLNTVCVVGPPRPIALVATTAAAMILVSTPM